MTQRNDLITRSINMALLGKRMLLGAGIALTLITIFLLNAGAGDPSWGKLSMARPLIIVPLAGATGGAFYHFMDHVSYKGGWKRVLANILSLIVFIIGLWMGTVLGLVGTYWH